MVLERRRRVNRARLWTFLEVAAKPHHYKSMMGYSKDYGTPHELAARSDELVFWRVRLIV
jgi:hypothetical protein